MGMKKFPAPATPPRRRSAAEVRERGSANLRAEATRQQRNIEAIRNPLKTTFQGIRAAADDKQARENYGPGTRKYITPMMRDAAKGKKGK